MSAPITITPLTARETEVIDLLEDGASTNQVTTALVISAATTRNHIAAIMSKLGAHSRLEAVAIHRGEKTPAQDDRITVMDIVGWLLAHDVYLNDTLLAELCTDFGSVATATRLRSA